MELVTQARSALCHAARLWAEPAIPRSSGFKVLLRVSARLATQILAVQLSEPFLLD